MNNLSDIIVYRNKEYRQIPFMELKNGDLFLKVDHEHKLAEFCEAMSDPYIGENNVGTIEIKLDEISL